MKTMTFVALMMAIPFSYAQVATTFQKISQIQIGDNDGYYYFKTENGTWGPSGCSNASYAYVKPQNVSVSEQILSLALAAKMSGKRVRFTGTCDAAGGNYLQSNKIIVE